MEGLNIPGCERVFYYFEEISKIPRGSGDMKGISNYCKNFAIDHDLDYIQDEHYNMIIKKPATAGYEDAVPVILQGHLDMVCVKKDDCEHDFTKDPIELVVDGDDLYANGTSLGGDNGIAIAYMLALLEDKDTPHPALEAVMTVDEEIGLIGAGQIDLSSLSGKRMINLDSEEDYQILISCAGGARHTITMPYQPGKQMDETVRISVNGLLGGHSGAEIHKQRGNANKILGRILYQISCNNKIRIVSVNGGIRDNVIPFQGEAVIQVNRPGLSDVVDEVNSLGKVICSEFGKDEPNLVITATAEETGDVIPMSDASTEDVIWLLQGLPNGVICNCRDMDDLVETSTNLGIVETTKESVSFTSMVRSNKDSKREAVLNELDMWTKITSSTREINGAYPGWDIKEDSELQKIAVKAFEKVADMTPAVLGMHAGVECGILCEKIPGLDCISIGPTMTDVHSVNEKLSISSSAKMYQIVKEILRTCK
jgi:dipeptidase D